MHRCSGTARDQSNTINEQFRGITETPQHQPQPSDQGEVMHAPRITKATLIALVPVMAFSLGACSVDVSTPGTVTQPPTNLHTLSLEDQILDDTWNSQPADNREAMCDVYAVDPQSMWQAFNEGAHDAFTKEQFDAMMQRNCP